MISSGSPNSPIWIIGEAPGENETLTRQPFTGLSGQELTRLLGEVGIRRDECFITNVCHVRPPANDIDEFFLTKTEAKKQGLEPIHGRYPNKFIRDGLDELLTLLQVQGPRKLIIAFGNTALWALTGHTGITRWRGSELSTQYGPVLPTIHPAAILRDWAWRSMVLIDLRRGARAVARGGFQPPRVSATIAPRLGDWRTRGVEMLRARRAGTPTAVDIETRGGQIACVGLSQDKENPICIPFMSIKNPEGYWSEGEELEVTMILQNLLTSPGGRIIFQNGVYDLQYFAHQWGYLPIITDDTMLMQHVLYPGLRKALDFLSSLYCDHHIYWKDDGKTWDSSIPEEQLWKYNCEDAWRTWEIDGVLQRLLDSEGMRDQYNFQMQLFQSVLRIMLRGMRVDLDAKARTIHDLEDAIKEKENWFEGVLGHSLNVGSTKKVQELFYEDFGIKPIFKRGTNSVTSDSKALETIGKKQPLLRPLTTAIEETRSLRVLKNTFAEMSLSKDNRARCSYNLAGTETFRFSSSEDAFGSGTNLQNIPRPPEE